MADAGLVLPATPLARPPVPAGTQLEPDRALEWFADTLLAGGSPWRLVRLTEQGAGLVDRWIAGDPVGAEPAAGALARRLTDANLLHPRCEPRPLRRGEVDLVVPVRDAPSALERLLAALHGDGSWNGDATRDGAVRVVVVDDGSRDGREVERVASAHGADVVRCAVPGGPGAARNSGLAATVAPLVAFVDVDVVPPAEWLERLVGYLDDPLCGLVAPRVRGPVGTSVRERFERVASPLDLGTRRALARPGSVVPYVPSAVLLARRSALGHGFDPSLRVGEDVDLCWRLATQGWLVRYVPDVVATHAARGHWGAWLGQRVAYGTSAAALEARHGDAAAPLRADPRVLAPLLLVLAGRPRAAISLLGWSGASLARQLEGVAGRGGAESAARRLAVRGTVLAAPGLARNAFRSYGPALVAAAVALPPLRRPVATVALAATATRWWRAGRPTPALGFGALSVVDDLCYGTGVLVGAARARRLGALRPRLSPAASPGAVAIRRT